MMVAKERLKAAKVLLVEDNQADVGLTEYFLQKCKIPILFRVAQDGEEALKVLRQSSSFDGREDPDLVLLDLNLPKVDGREVLKEIKTDPGLRHIPVFIFSSSKAPQDLELARDYQADGYILKPAQIKGYEDVVREIEEFLLSAGGGPI